MKTRYIVFIFLALMGIFVLAFLLRGAVQEFIILPVAKFIWAVKGYYQSFPQADYWVGVLAVAVLIAFLGIRLPERMQHPKQDEWNLFPGSVRQMSLKIQRSKGGFYLKWQIARIMADLALDILDRRGTDQKLVREITDPDWNPPKNVKQYVDAALKTTDTDYRKPKCFRRTPPTPFDQDLEPVIKYLESLLESDNDHHS